MTTTTKSPPARKSPAGKAKNGAGGNGRATSAARSAKNTSAAKKPQAINKPMTKRRMTAEAPGQRKPKPTGGNAQQRKVRALTAPVDEFSMPAGKRSINLAERPKTTTKKSSSRI